MSKRDWGKFAKVVGLTSAAFLVLAAIYSLGAYVGNHSGYYEGQADRSAAQYPSDTQRIVDACFKLPSRAETVQCVEEATKAAHENQRAEYDLNAQRNMADWAWWVMIIGVLQFFATIATLGFIKLTLDATLEAVKDTSEATDAMREANKISREIARNELRPFFYPERAEVTKIGKGLIEVTIVLTNYGKGPARTIKVFARNFTTDFPFKRIHQFYSTRFLLGDCAPGASKRLIRYFMAVPAEDGLPLDDRSYTIVARVRYDYVDELGTQYSERIDYHIDRLDVELNTRLFITDATHVEARREVYREATDEPELFDNEQDRQSDGIHDAPIE